MNFLNKKIADLLQSQFNYNLKIRKFMPGFSNTSAIYRGFTLIR